VPLRLLGSYRGYVMTDHYADYNALELQPGVERLACPSITTPQKEQSSRL